MLQKYVKPANSRRSRASYDKRHNKIHISAKELPLRDHNWNLFLQDPALQCGVPCS